MDLRHYRRRLVSITSNSIGGKKRLTPTLSNDVNSFKLESVWINSGLGPSLNVSLTSSVGVPKFSSSSLGMIVSRAISVREWPKIVRGSFRLIPWQMDSFEFRIRSYMWWIGSSSARKFEVRFENKIRSLTLL